MLLQCVALMIATSCTGDGNDNPDGPFRPILASNAEEQAISDLTHAMQRELNKLRTRTLSDEQRARLDAVEAKVRYALRHLRSTGRRGYARGVAIARIGSVSAALLSDDMTGAGVANDGLLLLCGIAAVITIITTDGAATERQLQSAWHELHSSLLELQAVITDVTAVTTEACESTGPASRADDDADAESTELTAPLTDTSRRRGPDQKCSDEVLDTLQGEADRICKANGRDNTCSPRRRSMKRLGRLQCSEVLRRQAKHQACLASRMQVQERCFHETDAGHARAISAAEEAVKWCQVLAAQQCAADSPYNDR